MNARAFVTVLGAVTLGLVSLGALFFAERWLLRFSAPFLSASWIPTAEIALDCAALMAVGALIGRWGWYAILVLAGTIVLVRHADSAWLLRLFLDCFQNSRYWPFFLNSLAIHLLLLASLIAGASLTRPRNPAPLRIK